jgi:hypothetical protein
LLHAPRKLKFDVDSVIWGVLYYILIQYLYTTVCRSFSYQVINKELYSTYSRCTKFVTYYPKTLFCTGIQAPFTDKSLLVFFTNMQL